MESWENKKFYPIVVGAIVFIFWELAGSISSRVVSVLLLNFNGIFESLAGNYVGIFCSELLTWGICILIFQRIIKNRKLVGESKNSSFHWLVLLPCLIQIGWDVSALFLEEISINLQTGKGLWFAVCCLLASLSIGLLEETIWRCIIFGLMLKGWSGYKYGREMAVLVSSLFFGLCHYMNVLTGTQSLASTTIQVIMAVCMGIFLAALYLRTQHLFSVICIHGICNFSNFFSNEITGWNYQGYPWDGAVQILFSTGYLLAGIVLLQRGETKGEDTARL